MNKTLLSLYVNEANRFYYVVYFLIISIDVRYLFFLRENYVSTAFIVKEVEYFYQYKPGHSITRLDDSISYRF